MVDVIIKSYERQGRMRDWKEDLFNKTDYDWTDKEFQDWKVQHRKEVSYIVGEMRTYRKSVRSISDIMYAHRIDKLKTLRLNPIEESKRANELWREHLKRIKAVTIS